MHVNVRCDHCREASSEDVASVPIADDGTARLVPPRGWFVVAIRLPRSTEGSLRLACSSRCAEALVSSSGVAAALEKFDHAAREWQAAAAHTVAASRKGGAMLTHPALGTLTIRVLGPYDGHAPAAARLAAEDTPRPSNAT
jgi:hypothetical protein